MNDGDNNQVFLIKCVYQGKRKAPDHDATVFSTIGGPSSRVIGNQAQRPFDFTLKDIGHMGALAIIPGI